MTWYEEKDLTLMREILGSDIFSFKAGSRERGNAWQHIAETLNLLEGFVVTSRSVRDHFTTISKKYIAQARKQEGATGLGGEEPTEYETLIEEIIELSKESDLKYINDTGVKKSEQDDKQKAIDMRQTAMERFGQTKKRESSENSSDLNEKRPRRSSNDTIEFLREKMAADDAAKKEQRELERSKQDQFSTILETFQNHIQSQSEQSNQLQQQILLMMQQQQQQMQLLIQKKNN